MTLTEKIQQEAERRFPIFNKDDVIDRAFKEKKRKEFSDTCSWLLSQPEVREAGWIDVNERLPENENAFSNDTVLFWSKKHGFSMVGCYDYETNSWTRQPWEKGYEDLKFIDVTHWQPLPPPPSTPSTK